MANQQQTGPDQQIESQGNMKERWIRAIYLILFFIIGYFLRLLIMLVSIFQFLSNIIFEKSNPKLTAFGQSLSIYAYEIVRFLTYNTDQKPYPFNVWPSNKVYRD